MRRADAWKAVLLLAALAFVGACGRHKSANKAAQSPLFTGNEEQREVVLTFPALDKPGFVLVKRKIYATSSTVAQAKQVLLALMAGPLADGSEAGATACFGPGAAVQELYLDGKGLAVVDLAPETVQGLPGGTSAEVATLYCLIRSLSMNIPAINRVKLLVDGEEVESLRGHIDLRDPLSLADF